VQILDEVSPIAVADIDGDALDDTVMFGDPVTWWSPDARGGLAPQGPIEMSQRDVLIALPGESNAALVRGGGELEIHAGNGDGSFASPVTTAAPEDGYEFSEWIEDVAPGVVWAERWADGCPSFCGQGGWMFGVSGAGAELIATTPLVESFLGVGDVDADGARDVFVWREEQVLVRRAPDYDFSEPLVDDVGVELLQVGDFDGDGATDVIISKSGWIGVYWNDGGVLPAMPMVLDGITLELPVLRRTDDVDGDGAVEVVLGDDDPTTWTLLRWSSCD
jgi:hypothetical protein